MLDAEFRRQERVDKGNIVVNAPDFKYFLAAQAKLFVPLAPLFQIREGSEFFPSKQMIYLLLIAASGAEMATDTPRKGSNNEKDINDLAPDVCRALTLMFFARSFTNSGL